MFSVAARCHAVIYCSREQIWPSPNIVLQHAKHFYGSFSKKPASKSEAKVILKSHKSRTLGNVDTAIGVCDVINTVRSRSQNQVIQKLQDIEDQGNSHAISDSSLEMLVRSVVPNSFFTTLDGHKLYRQRMNYIRKWFTTNRRSIPRSIWFLLLEEGRLDKAQNRSSQSTTRTWSAMLAAGIKPDVHCYNSYMAATCLQPASFDHVRLRRKHETSSRLNLRQRNKSKAQITVQNAVKVYRQMLSQGILPNSMTIELLILSLAWDANLDALKSLLLQTWNVALPTPNFDALMDQSVADEYEEEGIELEDKVNPDTNTAKYDKDDVLFPTQETLLVMAMAYGANSQCHLATSAVRLLANVYNLQISTKVWAELMKWSAADSEHLHGFTPRTYVEELFQMAQEEYGTRPSIGMYAILASHHLSGDRNPSATFAVIDAMLSSIEGDVRIGRPIYKSSKHYPHARQVVMSMLGRLERNLRSAVLQLERKRGRASAGPDELRLLDEDILRRKEHLLSVSAQWDDRVKHFDQIMGNLIMSQRTSQQICIDPNDAHVAAYS